MSELAHPAIAQIHDFDADENGHHFLVLEWIEGCDLQELVDAFVREGQPTPWSVMGSIAIDVLEALAAAHERRDATGRAAPIFHRDVTPHNVRLGALGYVKLTDFGIARAADRATITRPDAIKGKLSYVAPEMLRAAPASAQTDLFAVGVVLWESITGRRLFEAPSDMEVMFKVHEAKAEDLCAVRPDVPPALGAAVHRALARDPAARPESARAMAHELALALRTSAEPVEERRIAQLVSFAKGRTTVPAMPRIAAMPTTEIELEDAD